MELNLTTFVLEIINFLVLLWILKRLFIMPVRKAIEARQLEINKSLEAANNAKILEENLRKQFASNMKDWEKEKERKREQLEKELALERDRRLKAITDDTFRQQDLLKAQYEKKQSDREQQLETVAVKQSLKFLTRLLSHFSTKEIENSIINLFLDQFKKNENVGKLLGQDSYNYTKNTLNISSAFPLSEEEKAALHNALTSYQKIKVPCEFRVDPNLLAGIEITLGSSIIQANLRDELSYFSRIGQNG